MTEKESDREIVVSRTIGAPRERVWEAWTDPEQLIRWWGPDGFTNTFDEIDIRPGGVWRFVMHGPDGRDYRNKIIFREIVEPERITYTHSGDEGEDVHFESTVTFEDVGGKTLVTLRAVFPTAEERDRNISEYGAVEGGRQTLGRLAEHVTRSNP